mmetsp:Transcript_1904/g.3897  ORF Transcript_1904/g.3897 Transcript_1904/m.3897 type:complete len:134 (+) Transcript_1904:55-456(+)
MGDWFNFCDCRKTTKTEGEDWTNAFTARAGYDPSQGPQGRRQKPCGIGVTFVVDDSKALRVKSLTKDGPADLTGKVEEGDILASVDGSNVYCANPQEVGALLLGSAGSKVQVSFKKVDTGEELHVIMVRAPSQ